MTTRPRRPSPRHPIHVDSALFELDPSDDLGGSHHCRAQLTVAPSDPQVVTPTANTDLLGATLCDGAWFATQFDQYWSPYRAEDPRFWTLEFTDSEVGWFSIWLFPRSRRLVFRNL